MLVNGSSLLIGGRRRKLNLLFGLAILCVNNVIYPDLGCILELCDIC